MSKPRVRIVILCEDRAQQHFFRRLCERLDQRVPRIKIAPRGQGSAEQWVRKHYPSEMQEYRRKRHELVGLLTAIDGDRYGPEMRKKSLDDALLEAGFEVRQPEDRVAVCVPTWSIETWFAWLCALEEVDELTQYKKDPAYKGAERDGSVSPTKAADRWFEGELPAEREQLPSLVDGRSEFARLSGAE